MCRYMSHAKKYDDRPMFIRGATELAQQRQAEKDDRCRSGAFQEVTGERQQPRLSRVGSFILGETHHAETRRMDCVPADVGKEITRHAEVDWPFFVHSYTRVGKEIMRHTEVDWVFLEHPSMRG